MVIAERRTSFLIEGFNALYSTRSTLRFMIWDISCSSCSILKRVKFFSGSMSRSISLAAVVFPFAKEPNIAARFIKYLFKTGKISSWYCSSCCINKDNALIHKTKRGLWIVGLFLFYDWYQLSLHTLNISTGSSIYLYFIAYVNEQRNFDFSTGFNGCIL